MGCLIMTGMKQKESLLIVLVIPASAVASFPTICSATFFLEPCMLAKAWSRALANAILAFFSGPVSVSSVFLSLLSCFCAFLSFFTCFLLLACFLLFFLLFLERCFELEDESDEESLELSVSEGSEITATGAGTLELELAAVEIVDALLIGAVAIAPEPRFVPFVPTLFTDKTFIL